MSFNTEDDFLKKKQYSVNSSYLDKTLIKNEEPIVLTTFLFEDGNNVSIFNQHFY